MATWIPTSRRTWETDLLELGVRIRLSPEEALVEKIRAKRSPKGIRGILEAQQTLRRAGRAIPGPREKLETQIRVTPDEVQIRWGPPGRVTGRMDLRWEKEWLTWG
ncbi:MAG: hypothetical protein M0P73_19590 [Syntrophobacterales bacterium]|jgi:hypothetical protein|nr:hypothetical protein [Syntrophobacterales bacterium]